MGRFMNTLIAVRQFPHPSTVLRNPPAELTLPEPKVPPGAITRENVEQLYRGQTLYHRVGRNADGTALRCRVSGQVKTWVTRPHDFSVPVKYGLYTSFYLEPINADEWTTEEPPARPRRRRGR